MKAYFNNFLKMKIIYELFNKIVIRILKNIILMLK